MTHSDTKPTRIPNVAADITRLRVDAVGDAANPTLPGGGADDAIDRAAGRGMHAAAQDVMCTPGRTAVVLPPCPDG